MKTELAELQRAAISDGIPPYLALAVARQIGENWAHVLTETAEHSADAGWNGFTYYHETTEFARRHKRAIVGVLSAMAGDIGETTAQCLAGFRCLPSEVSRDEAAAWLACGRVEKDVADMLGNALAWFALEEVARAWAERGK